MDENHDFVDYINQRLYVVRKDAFALLSRVEFRPKKFRMWARFGGWLSIKSNAARQVLNKDQIACAIKGVEEAQSHLQLALTLASLHASELGQGVSS